ncbi:efflux RND transporter periplasmic adaptor subunit [Pseudoalteromonas denitrificans]|uniref:Multidrug efflux pump subunit AcrA (Membrane-fusion protein) n=1 Tax=Pseudoalteromonas denitrificans DSM 6059 TaxID=1123010 RepID=A0A1I1PI15_9GAMM|nr:HlyD family efflux transporter periplasmic adaptor subunit [Pseudoalteromonas denitrificans]SFD09445.1 Multidrug efflux pump subunit AcrA (membrane-fusion protein) [Pseudoalteromonas denitrificans DSM 6059]
MAYVTKFITHLKVRQSIAFLISLFILLIVIDELAAQDFSQSPKAPIKKVFTASIIKAQPVDKMPKIQLLAMVEPIKESQITAQVSGKVTQISDDLRLGRSLRENKPLLVIEPFAYQVALAQAKADLLEAKVELKKTSIHFNQNSLAVNLANAKFELAQTQFNYAQEQLKQTNIVLPYAAEITEIKAYLGEYITPGQELITVLPKENKQISVRVNEQDFAHLAELTINQVIVLSSLDKKQHWQSRILAISQHSENLQRSVYLELLKPTANESANEPLYGQHIYAMFPIKGWKKTMSLPESVLTLQGKIWWFDTENKIFTTQLNDYVLANNKIYFPEQKSKVNDAVLYPLPSLSQGLHIHPILLDGSNL